jgi:hypothetical protein
MYYKKGVRVRVCISAAGITHQETEIGILNVGSSFRMTMGCPVPKIIKIGPRAWVGPQTSWHHWCKSLLVVMVTTVIVFSVRRRRNEKQQPETVEHRTWNFILLAGRIHKDTELQKLQNMYWWRYPVSQKRITSPRIRASVVRLVDSHHHE